jgi:hypothetical protein
MPDTERPTICSVPIEGGVCGRLARHSTEGPKGKHRLTLGRARKAAQEASRKPSAGMTAKANGSAGGKARATKAAAARKPANLAVSREEVAAIHAAAVAAK